MSRTKYKLKFCLHTCLLSFIIFLQVFGVDERFGGGQFYCDNEGGFTQVTGGNRRAVSAEVEEHVFGIWTEHAQAIEQFSAQPGHSQIVRGGGGSRKDGNNTCI